jgi:hypothetical protein
MLTAKWQFLPHNLLKFQGLLARASLSKVMPCDKFGSAVPKHIPRTDHAYFHK